MADRAVELDRNESPFGVTRRVLAAWERQRTADRTKYGLNRYGDFFQTAMLEALQRHHGLTVANYTPLAGPMEVATVLAAALLRSGDELVQSHPIGDLITRPARAWGARIVRRPLDEKLRQDLDVLADAVGPDTRLVHLQNPHDPSGRSFGHDELERFLEAVRERNSEAYVWVDESYAPYSTRSDFQNSFEIIARNPERSRLAVSRSLTTAHGMAGCPVAYLAASRELTYRTEGVTIGTFVPGAYGWANTEAEVNRMAEKALLTLLTPHGEEHLREVRAKNAAARERLADLLERHRFEVTPSDSSYVFARAPMACGGGTMSAALADQGVLVASSSDWGRRFRDHVRVSVGGPSEMDRLEAALTEVAACSEPGVPGGRDPGRQGTGEPAGNGVPRFPRGGVETGYGGTAVPREESGEAARRALLMGAAAAAGAAGAGAVLGSAGRLLERAPEPELDDDRLGGAVSRRGFLAGVGAAAGSAAFLGGLAWPRDAPGFPPDSFYDSFDLARMIYHENPVGPHPAALEAVREVIVRGPRAARRYQPIDPAELVEAILRYNARRSRAFRRLGPENVMVTLGSAEGLLLAADTFVASGTLVSEWPTYPIIRNRIFQAGGTVVDVPLTSERKPDYGALKQALRDHPGAGIVHFNVQNNPMGTVIDRRDFDPFVRWVSRNHPHTVVIADESDREWMQPGLVEQVPDFARHILEGRNLIHIQTFSHIFGLTGLRVGYLFATRRLLRRMRGKRIRRPASAFSWPAAVASIDNADDQIERCYPVIEEGRRYIYGELDEMGLRYSRSQGQYIFLDTGRSGTAVWATLIALGVLTRYGEEWGMESWIRVNPGLPHENERFVASLRVALNQPDPGNPPDPPFPGDELTAPVARRLRHRLSRDRWINSKIGPLEHPYRVTRAEELRR